MARRRNGNDNGRAGAHAAPRGAGTAALIPPTAPDVRGGDGATVIPLAPEAVDQLRVALALLRANEEEQGRLQAQAGLYRTAIHALLAGQGVDSAAEGYAHELDLDHARVIRRPRA